MIGRLRALLRDTRGGATLAPVFAIIGVIIIASVAASIATAAAAKGTADADRNAAAQVRSAVAALQADLNLRTTCAALATQMANPMYSPTGYFATPHEDIDFHTATAAGSDCRVTFDVTTTRGRTQTRSYTVEFRRTPLILTDGVWQDAGASTPTRTVWEPYRTVVTG